MHLGPDDFIPLQAGGLWVRRDLLPAFDRLQWTTADAILLAPQFEYSRTRPYFGGWDTGAALLPDQESGTQLRCHIKRFRRGIRSRSLAFQQADKVRLFQQAGIPCLDLIAVARLPAPPALHPFRSCLITEWVGDGESLSERLIAGSRQPRPAFAERRALFSLAAETIARMHASQIFHGDCKWLHLILDSPQADKPSCRFIDLERARRLRGPAAIYAWLKDLEKCETSLRLVDASPAEVDAWHHDYDAAYRAAGGSLAAWSSLRHRAQLCRRNLNRIRRPLLRAIQFNRHSAHRTDHHPLQAAKLRLHGVLAAR